MDENVKQIVDQYGLVGVKKPEYFKLTIGPMNEPPNIDEIETDLVEPDELSMYAPGNVLKTKVLGS